MCVSRLTTLLVKNFRFGSHKRIFLTSNCFYSFSASVKYLRDRPTWPCGASAQSRSSSLSLRRPCSTAALPGTGRASQGSSTAGSKPHNSSGGYPHRIDDWFTHKRHCMSILQNFTYFNELTDRLKTQKGIYVKTYDIYPNAFGQTKVRVWENLEEFDPEKAYSQVLINLHTCSP